MQKPALKKIGIFTLTMITVGSVDSIRNLPATALFGSTIIFFFLLAALLFLIPSALISAELSSTTKTDGGIYCWVTEAFNSRLGLLAIWFQWIENVIWYPTILAFIAGTLAYVISPQLINNKLFLITIILTAFWGMTALNLLGVKTAAKFSNLCAVLGLLFPMLLIISLGTIWILMKNPLAINLTVSSLLPQHGNTSLWVALTAVILSFGGMEIATVHAQDVPHPQRTFPRAMLISTCIILITLLLGSMTLAMVIPSAKISLVAGIMQTFDAFFSLYHLHWILPLIACMLFIGAMGSVNNWIIAPTRGLLFALQEIKKNSHLCQVNRFGAPTALLLWQSIIVTLMSAIFLLLPSVNGAYWFLSVLTAQLYMLMYMLMFASAIALRYRALPRRDGFMIWGKNWGMWFIASVGFTTSCLTFFIGFIPPQNINIGTTWHYELLLLIGLILMCSPPVLLTAMRTLNEKSVMTHEIQHES